MIHSLCYSQDPNEHISQNMIKMSSVLFEFNVNIRTNIQTSNFINSIAELRLLKFKIIFHDKSSISIIKYLYTIWWYWATKVVIYLFVHQSLSAQCEGAPVPLVLDNGNVIPPANLTNIPICAAFNMRNLKPHLQPTKIQHLKQDIGPFLFTPIHFGSLDRRNTKSLTKMGEYLSIRFVHRLRKLFCICVYSRISNRNFTCPKNCHSFF